MRSTFFLVFRLLLVPAVLVSAGALAQAGGPRLAPDWERALIEPLLTGLDHNQEAMPIPVVNTMRSLEKTLDWSFDCPAGTKLEHMRVLVRTDQIAWDAARAGRHGSVGTYFWETRMESLGGRATITANNWVMLNPKTLKYEAGKGEAGKTVNESILYHELLHGELLILAMATHAWQRKACNMILDLHAIDGGHRYIDPAVNIYLGSRSRLLLKGSTG